MESADFGVLGTVGADGEPHLVPVVFAVVDDDLMIPIDRVKAKRSTRLRRVDNLERDPRATVLVDHRSSDWSQLWWVRVDVRFLDHAPTESVAPLRAKYEVYADPDSIVDVLRFRIERWTGWAASSLS